jgi:signal transduction histidine kinase
MRDDGPGLPPAELETIFRRVHRVGPTRNGSGLGLAIAQGIVELHGGRIWAEGGLGRGLAFYVALPRHDEGTPP